MRVRNVYESVSMDYIAISNRILLCLFSSFYFVLLTSCKTYSNKCNISPLYSLSGPFRRGRFVPLTPSILP
jgi:hypothetical protein